MGVVIDFGGTTLDGTVAGHVPYENFDEAGLSQVFQCMVKSSVGTEYRPSPNDVTLFSDSVRVGLSEVECLAAPWGESLAVDLDITPYGFPLYIQFRRTMNSEQVTLSDVIGMADTGFSVILGAMGTGFNVSSSQGVAVSSNPGIGNGYNISYGIGEASGTSDAAAGIGYSVLSGSGVAASKNPGIGTGYNIISGSGTAAHQAPAGGPTIYYPTATLDGTYIVRTMALSPSTTANVANSAGAAGTNLGFSIQMRVRVINTNNATVSTVLNWTNIITGCQASLPSGNGLKTFAAVTIPSYTLTGAQRLTVDFQGAGSLAIANLFWMLPGQPTNVKTIAGQIWLSSSCDWDPDESSDWSLAGFEFNGVGGGKDSRIEVST